MASIELQLAVDRIPLTTAVALTERAAPYVDWVEAGTSMVKRYGEQGLRDLVRAAGSTPVLADMKTVDDVTFETGLVFDCGARATTVMGLAPRATVDRAVQLVAERGGELLVDLLGLDEDAVAATADRLPADVVLAAHVGKDTQDARATQDGAGAAPTDLLGPWAEGRRVALAGGLTPAAVAGLDAGGFAALRVIAGSAITQADDPVAAVSAFRSAIRQAEERQGHDQQAGPRGDAR